MGECESLKGCESVSVPGISSGIFGYPVEECAEILVGTSVKWAGMAEVGGVKEVRMCNFDMKTYSVFAEEVIRVGKQWGSGGG